MFSQKVAKTSLTQEALWVAKEQINAKVCVAASRKKNGKMFTRSNQCSSHVAKGAPAMTSGPFCHEHGGGGFKN